MTTTMTPQTMSEADARKAPCPTCGAGNGFMGEMDPCRTLSQSATRAHMTRRRAALALIQGEQTTAQNPPTTTATGGMTLVQVKGDENGTHHTVNITDPLRVTLTRQVVRYMVQRAMFCPFTGKTLDYRTAVALGPIDASGDFDPKTVMHPDAWRKVKDNAVKHYPTWYVWHMPIR